MSVPGIMPFCLLDPIQSTVMPVPALLRACPIYCGFRGLGRVNYAGVNIELATVDTLFQRQ